MGKLGKALKYGKFRLYEFKISLKEFFRGGKLDKKAYQQFEDSNLLVSAHSVEKGLGLPSVEPGHSGSVVDPLLDKLLLMSGDKKRTEGFPYQETLRIVMAYMDYQEQYDTSSFALYPSLKRRYDRLCKKLGEEYMESLQKTLDAGAPVVSKEELEKGKAFDFSRFIGSRHSIREYEKRPLDEKEVKRAVEIANQSPSACNRQPSHVYFTNQPAVVAKIDDLITGSSGFKGEVPNYMVLTTDRAYFSYEEQYQWYINGGIYLAYLSLALHAQGIGHCIMQWKAFYKTEEKLKQLLGISKTEAIIAIIGCGYFKDDIKCIRAQRKTAEDSLQIIS